MTMAQAQSRIVALTNQLAQARGDVLTSQQRQRDCRAQLAAAIVSFQSGFAPVTHESNVRAYLKAEAELRAARAARGEVMEQDRGGGPGPSLVDRMAYGRGGAAGTRRDSWRRGSMPSSMRGASLRPKAPSEV